MDGAVALEDGKQLDIGQIENVFSVTKAVDKNTRAMGDLHNVKGMLNRHEWLQVLVRLAMRKFCRLNSQHNLVGDVADAVDRFCTEHLATFLPRVCLVNPNDFRRAHCYREGTDVVIKEQRQTLRNLYEYYSATANGAASVA